MAETIYRAFLPVHRGSREKLVVEGFKTIVQFTVKNDYNETVDTADVVLEIGEVEDLITALQKWVYQTDRLTDKESEVPK